MMTDTYRCSMCGEEFEKGWSDEEAMDESREIFGEHPPSEMDVVCDDCWQEIKPIDFAVSSETVSAEREKLDITGTLKDGRWQFFDKDGNVVLETELAICVAERVTQ